MKITEVRIKLMEEPGERLKAFCSITFDDCFVTRDLKIIEGTSGPFVAMPSRKLTAHCPGCGMKNHLRSNFCNQCGKKLDSNQAIRQPDGRAKLYADIAHPINSACREMIQEHVIREYEEEIERAKQPGYVSTYDEYDDDHPPASSRTRVDESHSSQTASAPHHPPQSRPIDTSTPSPPSQPHHISPDGGSQPPKAQQQKSTGFGEGIFGDS
ncbi:MAG: SpoVG family protein [Aeoliella sp.]